MYTLEKINTSPICILMYTNASNKTPPYTHVTSYTVLRVHPWGPWLGYLVTRLKKTNYDRSGYGH